MGGHGIRNRRMSERDYQHHRTVTRLIVLERAIMLAMAIVVISAVVVPYGATILHLFATITDAIHQLTPG